MSKVLIDRELLERAVYRLELVYDADAPIVCDLSSVLAAPSGTPAMPVKAYYHEAPNEYGGLNKSVGLEVRKAFADAPLVLESDALARIACLEGEIAKRDARIMGLESQYQRDVWGLNNEGDPIGGEPAGGYANDNARLRAELSAIKAQEPVCYTTQGTLEIAIENWNGVQRIGAHVKKDHRFDIPLYAAPVSEAKAQGVVQWPEADEIMQMAFEEGQPADDASGYCFELEEFDLFIERLMSEVARLNAAPAAPAADAWLVEALDYQALFDAIAAATSVYANGAINISVQAFRDALAAHCAKGVV